ncbi:molybdopterin-synthase adenylyltransferase MoeB [Nitrincola tapanii]|uniref:Molybdopterin-synthase adenylyltransferase n=1 Tax=Nitrincola tapanii TaxID=1708751 RepID=A0A5A9W8V2_9GAMM|nr:molybdopterin-synthase adenylyltransferase MoeB [Nitrincola tapanii]KAA0876558.1 molybdopterin-synthase adenylyltransferase MoeB [Nitrincola tapanii]
MRDEELLRYSRHLLLPEMDVEGQERLLASRVLILGLGGLGSPVALYLAAAGVGQLWLADDDVVDLSNLQRQILHTAQRIGESKVDSAMQSLQALNPGVTLHPLRERLDEARLQQLLQNLDLVVDCTDNFAIRFALNRACAQAQVPWVSGAAIGLNGQVSVYDFRQAHTPCYQCLYPEGDDQAMTCSESGVLAPLVGVIGTVQALEAVKLLAGIGESLAGRLLLLEGASLRWREMTLRQDPACPVCLQRQQGKLAETEYSGGLNDV